MSRARVLMVLGAVAALGLVLSCRTCRPDRPIKEPKKWKAPPAAPAVVVRNARGPCDAGGILDRATRAAVEITPLVTVPQGANVRVPEELQRYCVILARRPAGSSPRERRPDISPALRRAIEVGLPANYERGNDYSIVMPTASPLLELAVAEHHTTFLERAGQPEPGGAQWPQGLTPRRIAVLDTVAGNGPDWPIDAMGSDRHGAPLARMIQELTCPEGNPANDCLTEVVGFAAMPSTIQPNQPVGLLSDLATALTDAVIDAAGAPQVINLSLGWVPVPELGGDDIAALPPATKAVYEALRFAACNNNLVLAAAGNNLGTPVGGFNAGPTYPAAWQARRNFDCADYGGNGTHSEPVVHAVGAVGHAGRRIGLTRIGSFPNLAAYGVNGVAAKVVATPPPAEELGRPMTGTSVATAVASAAAAVRWALVPSLDNQSIVNVLRDPVTASPEKAEFPSGTSTKVSQLSVCSQITSACASSTSSCGGLSLTCRTQNPPAPAAGTLAAIKGQLTVKPVSGLVLDSCSGGPAVYGPAGNTSCMNNLTISVDEDPWVHPQPGCDPCSPCLLTLGSGTSGPTASGFFTAGDDCFTWQTAFLEIKVGGTTSRIDLLGIAKDAGIEGELIGDGIVLDDIPLPGPYDPTMKARLVVGVDSGGPKSTATEIPITP